MPLLPPVELTGKRTEGDKKTRRRAATAADGEAEEGVSESEEDETGASNNGLKADMDKMAIAEEDENTKVVESGAFTISSTVNVNNSSSQGKPEGKSSTQLPTHF